MDDFTADNLSESQDSVNLSDITSESNSTYQLSTDEGFWKGGVSGIEDDSSQVIQEAVTPSEMDGSEVVDSPGSERNTVSSSQVANNREIICVVKNRNGEVVNWIYSRNSSRNQL